MSYERRAIIAASGNLLIEHLPEDFEEWENEKLDKWMLERVWEPFEYYEVTFIWEQIHSLAHSLKSFHEKEQELLNDKQNSTT